MFRQQVYLYGSTHAQCLELTQAVLFCNNSLIEYHRIFSLELFDILVFVVSPRTRTETFPIRVIKQV